MIRPGRLLEACVPVNILCATVRSNSHPIKYLSALPGTEKQIVTAQTGEVDLFGGDFISTITLNDLS
jgi:hypothetical protein